jgi:radical SAM protein with 4Fe4S-binding SPASM domain
MKFHQYILLQRGPVNTAIIDFLTGNIYHEKNEIVDNFLQKKYKNIKEFVDFIKKEGLIINVDDNAWIPKLELLPNDNEDLKFELELEEGVDLELIREKFANLNVSKIFYFGKKSIHNFFPNIEVIGSEKDFNNCINISKKCYDANVIDKNFYVFNLSFNSCWGKKIAVTKDEIIRPCIYSRISLGHLRKDNFAESFERAKKNWKITKDKIEKCKYCELRYVCFDCREIAFRKSGDKFGTNPYCEYDPQNRD